MHTFLERHGEYGSTRWLESHKGGRPTINDKLPEHVNLTRPSTGAEAPTHLPQLSRVCDYSLFLFYAVLVLFLLDPFGFCPDLTKICITFTLSEVAVLFRLVLPVLIVPTPGISDSTYTGLVLHWDLKVAQMRYSPRHYSVLCTPYNH